MLQAMATQASLRLAVLAARLAVLVGPWEEVVAPASALAMAEASSAYWVPGLAPGP